MIALIGGLTFLGMLGATLWKFNFKARFLPLLTMAIIIVGIGSLAQPWIKPLYRYGLSILMSGIAGYILVSHFE